MCTPNHPGCRWKYSYNTGGRMDAWSPGVCLDNKQFPYRKSSLKAESCGFLQKRTCSCFCPQEQTNLFARAGEQAACCWLRRKQRCESLQSWTLKKNHIFSRQSWVTWVTFGTARLLLSLDSPSLPILFCVKQDPFCGGEKIPNNESTPLGSDLFYKQFYKHSYGSSALGVSYIKLCGYVLYGQVQLW